MSLQPVSPADKQNIAQLPPYLQAAIKGLPHEPEGLDIFAIRARPYGKLRFFKWNDITHMVLRDEATRAYCGSHVPRYITDVTEDLTVDCENCCRLILKRGLRIH